MVDEVAVAGLPDKNRGEAVKAWVTLKPENQVGVDITGEKLKKWCAENMARWKCPTYIEFIKELPVTTTGKVLKLKLQKMDLNKLKEGKKIDG